MSINIDLEATRLLDWLADQPDNDRLYQVVANFTEANALPENNGRQLAEHLRDRGWVSAAIGLGGEAEVIITTEGTRRIHEIRSQRRNPRFRANALRQQMLEWLFHREDTNQTTMSWDDFIADRNVHALGESFTEREIEREANSLVDKGLIISTRTLDQAGPGTLWPQLTDAGRDCVMDAGGNVAEYLDRQRGGPTNYNFNNNTGSFVVGNNNDVTQTVRTGVDAAPFLDFAAAVSQILPVSNLPAEQQTEVDGQAQELVVEAKSSAPDKGKLRRLLDAIMEALIVAATPATTAIVNTLGNDAVRALGGH